MGKGWSVLFGVVLFASFIIWPAAIIFGWWLPENIGPFVTIDTLFYLILGFTTFFFVLTAVVQVYAMWVFAERPGEKATYTHGNHLLEVFWTAIPAAILLFIGFAQISAWAQQKYISSMPGADVTIGVMARQWEWRMRYPSDPGRFYFKPESPDRREKLLDSRAWAENPAYDDVHVPNEIHCWKSTETSPCKVRMYLQTRDVLHSFTIPHLRIKQDTLPGKTIPMWFEAKRENCYFEVGHKDKDGKHQPLVDTSNKVDRWEITCQELCGGRHYAMRGRLYVHRDKKSFDSWLEYTRTKQEAGSEKVAKGE